MKWYKKSLHIARKESRTGGDQRPTTRWEEFGGMRVEIVFEADLTGSYPGGKEVALIPRNKFGMMSPYFLERGIMCETRQGS